MAETLDFQVFYGIGTAIKFPIYVQNSPFTPNGILINNQSAASLQVGPQSNGPFIGAGPYQVVSFPWNYGQSCYVSSINNTAPLDTDFLDVHFLDVSAPGGFGAPSIIAGVPAGWGGVGPGNTLENINAGDPFNYGQAQQFVNLLTGVMTGQSVVVSNLIESAGPLAQLVAADRDGIGGDYVALLLSSGIIELFSSVFGATVLTINETGKVTLTGTAGTLQIQDNSGIAANYILFQNAGGHFLLYSNPFGDNLLVFDQTSGQATFIARVSSNATGASNAPLLNWVPINSPTGANASGAAAVGLTSISIATDVPASAAAVAIAVVFTSTTGQSFGVFNADPNTNAQVSGISPGASGVLGLPTAQTLWYTVVGAGAWGLTIYPTAYAEPS